MGALSMSGQLTACIATQIMIKYGPPPLLTVVYHLDSMFEEVDSSNQFYHEIAISPEMLQTKKPEEVVSFLYNSYSYYLNPERVKRPQLLRLVGMLQ